jgi:predicted transcriptional regulator
MSKSNAKSPRVSIEDIAAQRAKIEAELAKLNEKESEAKLAYLKEIEQKILGLTELFGVPTLGDVRNLIARHEKGVLFQDKPNATVGERAPRVTLTDEQKDKLLAGRRAGKQYSDLANEFGVSTQTVFNYCKAAGLTVPRKSEETPVAVATPSA